MNEIFCGKCDKKLDKKSVNSFGVCAECDEKFSAEISLLGKAKRFIGAGAFIVFFLLIPMVFVPLLLGPESNGLYRMKENRGPRHITIGFGELIFGGFIIFTIGTAFSFVYFYLRQKLLKKEAALYSATIVENKDLSLNIDMRAKDG